ncbi:MAG: tetratricopeptide repeat protein [Candidatus Promineifilaceae bacterium]
MSEELTRKQAQRLLDLAYVHHSRGELGDAIELYKRSIALYPTAEAYTYLGWAYSMIGQLGAAIEYCEKAIELDPDFGNPYNDIGAYLIDLEEWEAAIPWLEKALVAKRYDTPHFPCYNLGRVYEHLGRYREALTCYNEALAIDPTYQTAQRAKYALLAKLN